MRKKKTPDESTYSVIDWGWSPTAIYGILGLILGGMALDYFGLDSGFKFGMIMFLMGLTTGYVARIIQE